MSSFAHALSQIETAFAAFEAHGLKATSKRDRDFIASQVGVYRDLKARSVESDLDAARFFFDYIGARTKVAARVEWTDYVAPDAIVIREENNGAIVRAFDSTGRCLATAMMRRPYTNDDLWTFTKANGTPAGTRRVMSGFKAQLRDVAREYQAELSAPVVENDARPVLYFEQDGAHFSYRDRPFYFVDFDYVGPDGMSAGVCPSFSTVAPFRVTDFDMAGAERAVTWFEGEAARHGYRIERAPDFYSTTEPVAQHPDIELADLAFVRADDGEPFSMADFVAYRAAPVPHVERETFQAFEPWAKAYLNLVENWFVEEYHGPAMDMVEEYYTQGLTPYDAANVYCKLVNGATMPELTAKLA
jgi:hypothetical protein